MYIVIQIRRPLTLLRNLHHTVCSICFDDYHHDRLQLFSNRTEAQSYMETQQHVRLNFLMLSFTREFTRSLLLTALENRNHDAMQNAISLMILSNSSSQSQLFDRNNPNNTLTNPVTTSSSNSHKRKAPDEFSIRDVIDVAKEVPDFCLADDVIANLKNKKYTDPVSLEEVDISNIRQFACVSVKDDKSDKTIYQIYNKEDLIQHINTNGALDNRKKEFRDINTNAHVRTDAVFSLTPDQLYNYCFPQELETSTKIRRKSR